MNNQKAADITLYKILEIIKNNVSSMSSLNKDEITNLDININSLTKELEALLILKINNGEISDFSNQNANNSKMKDLIQNIKNITDVLIPPGIMQGGNNNIIIKKLLGDRNFVRLAASTFDNITNMIEKSDLIMNNVVKINDLLNNISSNKLDDKSVEKYFKKIQELLVKSNELFGSDNINNKDEGITEMLFEEAEIETKDDKLYKAVKQEDKMLKLADIISSYNDNSKNIYEIFKTISDKLDLILNKFEGIDKKYIKSGKLNDILTTFNNNNKNNTINNLSKINSKVEEILETVNIKTGGAFFLIK